MKILASDYDGTLNVQGVVSKENIEAIAAWRAAGNLFGVVSGRNLGSIKKFVDKDGVPYDYMVGCNGSVMTDAQGNRLPKSDFYTTDANGKLVIKDIAAVNMAVGTVKTVVRNLADGKTVTLSNMVK